MKRAHRKSHLLIWLILAPVLIGTLLVAVNVRPAPPLNDALPPVLLQEVP